MIIKNAEIKALAVKPSQYPADDRVEIAFAGRSNVGKSSLLNYLTGRKSLARVSGSPGKTRTINFFDIFAKTSEKEDIEFRIVDLPGYGYAKVSKKITDDWGKMMETFLTSREGLRIVVQLVDCRHEPTAQDVQMYDYLKHYGLSGVVVATKSDKLKRSQLSKSLSVIRKTLDLDEEDIIIPVSALKREGADRLMDVIEKIVLENRGA